MFFFFQKLIKKIIEISGKTLLWQGGDFHQHRFCFLGKLSFSLFSDSILGNSSLSGHPLTTSDKRNLKKVLKGIYSFTTCNDGMNFDIHVLDLQVCLPKHLGGNCLTQCLEQKDHQRWFPYHYFWIRKCYFSHLIMLSL